VKLLRQFAAPLCCVAAFAQSTVVVPEPAAILELGAAANRNLSDRESSFGPNFAVEFTPVPKWLEIEAGVTPLLTRTSTEWDVDVLFKKPWDVSKKLDLMVGVGPSWIRTRQNGATVTAVAGVFVVDFMYWPSTRRRFGWYVEPTYEYTWGRRHESSIGISAGLLIAIQRRATASSR
jgi:hypothetical protein